MCGSTSSAESSAGASSLSHRYQRSRRSAGAIIALPSQQNRALQQPFRIGEAYHVEPSLNRVTGPGGIQSPRTKGDAGARVSGRARRADGAEGPAAQLGVGRHRGRRRCPHSRDLRAAPPVRGRSEAATRHRDDSESRLPPDRAGHAIAGGRGPGGSPGAGGNEPGTSNGSASEPSPRAHCPRRRFADPHHRRRDVVGATARSERDADCAGRATHGPARTRAVADLLSDGDQVAFEWDGENSDNPDIYIKMVGSSEVRRLTSDPAGDGAPSWSPDGRQIAYVRTDADSQGGRIHLVSPLGGSDRKLSDVPVSPPLAWSPDGRYLAAQRVAPPTGLYLIPVDGGEPRPIVTSKPPRSDRSPAFSPDGRRFAYGSCATPMFGCDVYVLDLDRALAPTSSPRRLTRSAVFLLGSLAWTRDGRSVIYFALDPLITYLWRVAVDGTHPPERIEVAGLGAAMPATTLSNDRLAFVRIVVDTDVYRFRAGRPSQPVLTSSFLETETRFSPDGRRLAFSSMRAGDTSTSGLAAADGSGAQQLTRGPGLEQGSPWWSPDGRKIAFDAHTDDGHAHIWIMDADGGARHPLTTDPGDQNVPYWSRDGRWIYFSADHGTGRDIWRVPAAGGRVTASHPRWQRRFRVRVGRRQESFLSAEERQTRRCSRCHSAEVPRGSSSPA